MVVRANDTFTYVVTLTGITNADVIPASACTINTFVNGNGILTYPFIFTDKFGMIITLNPAQIPTILARQVNAEGKPVIKAGDTIIASQMVGGVPVPIGTGAFTSGSINVL